MLCGLALCCYLGSRYYSKIFIKFYWRWWQCHALVLNLRLVLCAEITDGANVLGILQILACLGIFLSTDQLGGFGAVWLVCSQTLC